MPGTVVIGKLRYDIVSDSTKFEKGMRATRAELKRGEKAMKDSFTPLTKLRHERVRLRSDLSKGIITQRAYTKAMEANTAARMRLTAARRADMAAAAKLNAVVARTPALLQGTVSWLGRVALSWRKARKEKLAYALTPTGAGPGGRGGGGNNMFANFGGSLGSGLGMGGPGAGIGRMMGMAGMGPVGMGMAAIGGTAIVIQQGLKQFADYETAVVDLQVLMGDDAKGKAFVENLREIARTTPLTTKALVKNAQTMLGYGLSSEGLEDTLTRLGTVAGGDTARFDNLTRAFAQIQSAGKLMGQELLQLINAGFPIAEIAKQAGVEMKDFRKEMEKGAITADFVTDALISLTSAGGMMDGRLERQAETLNGHWTRMKGEVSEAFADLGEEMAPVGHAMIEMIKGLAIGTADWVSNMVEAGTWAKEMVSDLTGGDATRFGAIGVFNATKEHASNMMDYLMGIDREEMARMEAKTKAYEDASKARKKVQDDAAAQAKANADKLAAIAEKQDETFKKLSGANQEKIEEKRLDAMSESEKHAKKLSDLKMMYIKEEINWYQYDKLRAQTNWLEKERKNRLEEEKLLEKRKEAIDRIHNKRKDQINKEAEAAKERVNEFHRQFKEAAKGNAAGVDSSQAGADYSFLAKRQADNIEWKAQLAANDVREKQLDKIDRKQQRAIERAEKTAEWMENNLNFGTF